MGKTFHVAQADLEWIDFTFGDKGSGLAALCKKMSISSHDTAAFGDNYNDLPMLELVQYPFIHHKCQCSAAYAHSWSIEAHCMRYMILFKR